MFNFTHRALHLEGDAFLLARRLTSDYCSLHWPFLSHLRNFTCTVLTPGSQELQMLSKSRFVLRGAYVGLGSGACKVVGRLVVGIGFAYLEAYAEGKSSKELCNI